MKHMAYHDYMTGLPNKRKFFEDGTSDLEQAQKKGTPISLGLISVDNLHDIQNRYGLDASEAALQNLSQLMPKAFERFRYARIGDADLAILMIGLTLEQASKLMESFRELVEDHIVLMDELSFSFTISAGITSDNSAKLIDLLTQADNRLYNAREEGGNQICCE